MTVRRLAFFVELLDYPAMEQQPIPPEHADRLVAFFVKFMERGASIYQEDESDEEHVAEVESLDVVSRKSTKGSLNAPSNQNRPTAPTWKCSVTSDRNDERKVETTASPSLSSTTE